MCIPQGLHTAERVELVLNEAAQASAVAKFKGAQRQDRALPLFATPCSSPDDASPDSLKEGDLQLLEDPERPFGEGDRVEFGEHFAPARVIATKRKNDQTEQGAGGEPVHQEDGQQGPPGHDGVKQVLDHPANLPRSARNRASLRAAWRRAPSSIL